LDFDHLRRFTLGDRSLEREVLGLFRDQARTSIARLRACLDDRTWREITHTLKGSAAGVGAWPMRSAAEIAERLTGPERATQGPSAIDAIAEAFADAEREISRFLDG
jgi:HPt (histidine-containing phosphotransfer) domain-containing protein